MQVRYNSSCMCVALTVLARNILKCAVKPHAGMYQVTLFSFVLGVISVTQVFHWLLAKRLLFPGLVCFSIHNYNSWYVIKA